MREVIKEGLRVQRVSIDLGDDQFVFDADGEVFRNGFGQVFAKEDIFYSHEGKRKRISFKGLFDMLFVMNLDPKESVRRLRIKGSIVKDKRLRRKRVQAALNAHRKMIRRSDGRQFRSLTKAAKALECTPQAISKGIKENREVKGYKFKLLTN